MKKYIKLITCITLCFELLLLASCEPIDESPFTDTPTTEKPSDDKPSDDKPSTDKPSDDKPSDDKPSDEKPPVDEPPVTEPDPEILQSAIYKESDKSVGVVFHTQSGKKKVVSASSDLIKWASSNGNWGISGKKTEYDYVHASITSRNDYKEAPGDFPAVNFCEHMRMSYGGNWHVPSVDEMKLLYGAYTANTKGFDATLEHIGGTTLLEGSSSFWSCAQNSNGNMQYFNMGANTTGNDAQTTLKQVRCVRDVDENKSVSPVVYPQQGAAKVKTLQTTTGWSTSKIADGIIHYHFFATDDVTKSKQNVNVLEVDLNNENYQIRFDFSNPDDALSSISKRCGAIAGINGTFEMSSVYLRVNAYNRSLVPLDMSNDAEAMRYWKHGAAVVGDGARKVGIINAARGQEDTKAGGDAAISIYNNLPEINIFSSGPILIDNYDCVGERFGANPASSGINALLAQDYLPNTHERHPRTIVALTEDNDILFIVIDGRSTNSAGMTAKEMTQFIKKHFNPKWALNMDGGGSSAMYIKGKGGSDNNIVNYPSDNKLWDHYGERSYRTVFLVCPVSK